MAKKENIDSNYIHGSHPEEQDRLSKLNALLNRRCMKVLPIKKGYRVLDVGSGLGQFSQLMSQKVGKGGQVLGIERDKNQLKQAKINKKRLSKAYNLKFRKGNALALPLKKEEWESFDLVHTRFVLEHIHEPMKVVHQMMKAVKKEGKVFLADDDHISFRCTPEMPGFQLLWNAYIRSYERIGNDPYIGRNLVSYLHEAGAREIKNGLVFFGDCAGNESFKYYVKNLIGILEGAKALILKEKLLSALSFEKCIKEIEEWGNLPNAAIWYSLCWAYGTKTT